MEQKTQAVDTTEKAAAQETVTPTVTETDAEARIAVLEAEKAKLIEESSNYKLGMLKAKGKALHDENLEESDDDKMRRIAREAVADSRLLEIAQEQDGIIKAALKENKELKLAHLNKTTATPAAAVGTHTEGQAVTDTLVTKEQLDAFKARGWTDKDIERYKKNLQKYSGR